MIEQHLAISLMGIFLSPVFLSLFIASLLWTFGTNMAGQKEDRFISYLGVVSLCYLTAGIYIGSSAVIMSKNDLSNPELIIFILSFIFHILQSFLSILFGKLIWKSSWFQSFITWLIPLILFFICMIIFWVYIF